MTGKMHMFLCFKILKINRNGSFLIYIRQTWELLSTYITFHLIAGTSVLLPAELMTTWTVSSTALLEKSDALYKNHSMLER